MQDITLDLLKSYSILKRPSCIISRSTVDSVGGIRNRLREHLRVVNKITKVEAGGIINECEPTDLIHTLVWVLSRSPQAKNGHL